MAFEGTYLQQNQAVFQALNEQVPNAAFLGIQDFANTFFVQAKRATPIGWRYVPLKLTKEGEKLVRKGGFKGAKGNWNYKKLKGEGAFHKSSGTWKPSGFAKTQWQKDVDSAGRGITLYNVAPYFFVFEGGLYPNPPKGPLPKGKPWEKGWRVEGGYSKQAQGGVIGPLFNDDKFWANAQDVIARRITQVLNAIPNVSARKT